MNVVESERRKRPCGESESDASEWKLDARATLKAPRIYERKDARAKRNTRFKEQEEQPGRSLQLANKRGAPRACSTWFALPAAASRRVARHSALSPVLVDRSTVWAMSTRQRLAATSLVPTQIRLKI